MKVTFLLQTFNKPCYLQSIHDALIEQISKFDCTKYKLNILIIQDNIIGNKKEKDEKYCKNYNKVIETNKRLSKNEITEYYLNNESLKPCLSISNGIDYIFSKYKSDFFVTLEDDLVLSSNFVAYFIYVFEHLFDRENILYAAGESVFFDSRKNSVTTVDNNLNHDLVKLFDLEKFYTTFNFLPSTNFGTNLIGWNAIREIRRTQKPSGASEVQKIFKKLNYQTVMPIVPRCKDIGMTHGLGFSTLHHGNNVKEIKNTFILSETACYKMYPFFYNKKILFERSCFMKNKNCDKTVIFQHCNKNLGDALSEYIFKYLGYYIKTSNDYNICNALFIGSNLDRVPNSNNIQKILSSGFMDSDKYEYTNNNIYGVRGYLSLEKITNKSICLGDGALLLSKIIDYNTLNEIKNKNRASYKLGIIPHISDISKTKNYFSSQDIKIIRIDNSLSNFILECLECEYIVSSSLHGLIICDILQIPNYIIKLSFSSRSNNSYLFKYNDYYSIFKMKINDILNEKNNITEIIAYIERNYKKKELQHFTNTLFENMEKLII
jgi:pyruvyltransferase